MPGIDLEQVLAERGAAARKRGTQLMIGAGVLLLGVFAFGWGVGWIVDWFASADEAERLAAAGLSGAEQGTAWWWPWLAGLAVTGVIAGYGLWYGITGRQENPAEQDNSAFERSTLQQMTGRGQHAVTGALLVAVLLLPGKLLGEGLRMRREQCALSGQELAWGQRVVEDLHEKNDWLPMQRYGQAAAVVQRLIGAGVVWAREGKGRMIGQVEVRLEPGLMD
ncbi:MAG: hypothetical protein AAF797_15940 [Planctomycetota bacterium]